MARKPDFQLDVVPQKAAPGPDTSSETKKMTGFGSISDVAAAAPEKATGGEFATPKGKATPGKAAKTAAAAKEDEKNKAVEEALAKVGIEMMRELAALPYEAWAMFFSDPALKLDAKQQETLANSYFLIAKAIKPEAVNSWKILVALAMLQNTRIIMVKMREHNDRQKQMKQQMQEHDAGHMPQVSVI